MQILRLHPYNRTSLVENIDQQWSSIVGVLTKALGALGSGGLLPDNLTLVTKMERP